MVEELEEAGVLYTFQEPDNYSRIWSKFRYMRIYQGKKVDIKDVYVNGWHADFLRLLAHWNRHIDEWKYIEVLIW